MVSAKYCRYGQDLRISPIKYQPAMLPNTTSANRNCIQCHADRSKDAVRKNLGHIRAEAKAKDATAYSQWYNSLRKLEVLNQLPPSAMALESKSANSAMIFHDYTKFVGKVISLDLVQKWVDE